MNNKNQNRAELFANILANPEDDDLRLVFADWLEDHGEPERANLIRYQCEAASVPQWERTAHERKMLAEGLIEHHGRQWRAKELPAIRGIQWRTFERGFVSTIHVTSLAELYAHDEEIPMLAPISCVELAAFNEAATVRPKKSVPWVKRLRFDLQNAYNVPLATSNDCSLLTQPKILELANIPDGMNVDFFLQWLAANAKDHARSPRYEELVVEGSHTLGLPFVRSLIEAAEAANAEKIKWPFRKLDIGTHFVDFDSGYFSDPTIGEAGADLLATARFLDDVEIFDISRQRVGPSGMEVLITSMPKLRELEARGIECSTANFLMGKGTPIDRLDLSKNTLGHAGIRTLAACERLNEVKDLRLDTCEVGEAALKSIVYSRFWSSLRVLDLSCNPIGSLGSKVLAEAPRPEKLNTLLLNDADLKSRSTEALATINWLRDLFYLELSNNRIALANLTATLGNGSLRRLGLARNKLDARVIGAAIPTLIRDLFHLDLAGNPIGDEGASIIATSVAEQLHVLDLRGCDITGAGIIALSKARFPKLHTLLLAQNKLDQSSLQRLIDSPLLDTVRRLDLGSCALGESDGTATVIAKSPRLAKLNVLSIRTNAFKEPDILQLAESSHLRDVEYVNLACDSWRFSQESRERINARFGDRWPWDGDPFAFEDDEVENPYADEEEAVVENDDDENDNDD